MVAGIRPSRVSVRPNFAPSAPIATSQTDSMPTPPPKALPWQRAISGFGNSVIAFSIPASAAAPARRVAASASICSRIHARSPPAQKLFPSAASTTTRTASSAPS